MKRFLIVSLALSGLGSSVPGVTAGEPLIPRGAAQWRYLDSVSAESDTSSIQGWYEPEFDDSTWPTGQAILGYGDADVRTELSYGNHPQRKNAAVLFRRRFQISNRRGLRLLGGRICCDDGAIVWINGREVYRRNMPLGEPRVIAHAAEAIGPDLASERQYHPFAVTPDQVQDGDNLVAISVHQANPTSSDLAMDLELTALESDEEVTAFRQHLEGDESGGRNPQEKGQLGPVVRFEIAPE